MSTFIVIVYCIAVSKNDKSQTLTCLGSLEKQLTGANPLVHVCQIENNFGYIHFRICFYFRHCKCDFSVARSFLLHFKSFPKKFICEIFNF